MSEANLRNSYRDPCGFVFSRDGRILRAVLEPGRDDYDLLMKSGLYQHLVMESLLVPHEEIDRAGFTIARLYKIIAPREVPFLSYFFEWPFHALKDAALATLQVALSAADHGMMLKDASAYNMQFVDGKPVLIDTLSLERLRTGSAWVAYRQFCEHFLAPLALMALRDEQTHGIIRGHPGGIPIGLADSLLGKRVWMKPSLAVHIHWQSKVQERASHDTSAAAKTPRPYSLASLKGLLLSLRGAVASLEPRRRRRAWQGYYRECRFGEDYQREKESLVDSYLQSASPATVWDLGANTGPFSRIASRSGARVVAMDGDPSVIDQLYLKLAKEGNGKILPLVMDLADPSPGTGWMNQDSSSLMDRGPADCILALAIMHHLRLTRNIPFETMAEFFARIGKWLVIEFVPLADPNAQLLLRGRSEVFDDYTQQAFEKAFSTSFSVEQRQEIGASRRVLYLMKGTR